MASRAAMKTVENKIILVPTRRFVMCGCFDNCVCVSVICVAVFTVFLYCFVYAHLFLFVTSVRSTATE